jgi:hypothetical protein
MSLIISGEPLTSDGGRLCLRLEFDYCWLPWRIGGFSVRSPYAQSVNSLAGFFHDLRRHEEPLSIHVGCQVLIGILLALLCWRVWGLGITGGEDAGWALAAYQPGSDPAGDWARSQGRIWAFPIGTLILHALRWQGTLYGEVLRIGSFVAFFLAFHFMVAAYCGRKLALLAATLVVGSYVLRWDGNLLTTYPLMTYPSAVVFCAAVMFGRHYVASSAPSSLAVAGVLLFVSLFNNEGATLLFVVLFALTIIANDCQLPKRHALRWYGTRNPRTFGLTMVLIGSVTSYGVVAAAWSVAHPSTYDGFVFGSLHPRQFGEVLLSFATGNSILSYLVRQYVVVYGDLAGISTRVTYDLAQAAGTIAVAPLAILVGITAAALFFRLSVAIRMQSANSHGANDGSIWAIASGLAVSVLPVFPVALSAQRQSWYFDHGVQTYALTALSHFGLCLAIAGGIAAMIGCSQSPWQSSWPCCPLSWPARLRRWPTTSAIR